MEEKKKKLRRMAVWTLVIFAAIFASVMAALWMTLFNGGASAIGAIGEAFGSAWPILLIDLVLCAGVYFGYRYFINRKK
jgi:hypothetical protein